MIESIFNYQVTEYELERLIVRWSDGNEYLQNTSARDKLNDLHCLLMIRGDEQAAKGILENSIINNFIVSS